MEITKKNANKNWKYSPIFIHYSDLFFALIAIIITSPILLIIAIAIKFEDPKGSVFFKQKRIGKQGKPFFIYKFRSMHHGSEALLEGLKKNNEMGGPMFKIKNDPRITKVGVIIRRLSLDELPQLFNVLRGDMCLVGPRPALESEYVKYTSHDIQRTEVKPGCTGLWQVSGRNQLTFDEMVTLDLYYIKHQSFQLNMKIILRTFKEFTYKGSGY